MYMFINNVCIMYTYGNINIQLHKYIVKIFLKSSVLCLVADSNANPHHAG